MSIKSSPVSKGGGGGGRRRAAGQPVLEPWVFTSCCVSVTLRVLPLSNDAKL